MKRSTPLFFFLLISTLACRNSSNTSNCKYGTPVAIFTEHPTIQTHRFSQIDNEATEQVLFKDSLELTLVQNGCNEIRQQLQCKIRGNFQNETPDFWFEQSIQLLRRLGNMGPDYAAFNIWAQSIEEQQEDLKIAESVELQPGFFVTIDGIVGAENATLVLILSDQP